MSKSTTRRVGRPEKVAQRNLCADTEDDDNTKGWGLYVLIPSELRWRLKAAAALAQLNTRDYIVALLDRELPQLKAVGRSIVPKSSAPETGKKHQEASA